MRHAKVFYKTFRCSDAFPADEGDWWNVKEFDKVVERWTVVRKNVHGSFTVAIEQFVAEDHS